MQVPGEQYWEDGRIRADAAGYATYYDAVDACWVSARFRCLMHVAGVAEALRIPVGRCHGSQFYERGFVSSPSVAVEANDNFSISLNVFFFCQKNTTNASLPQIKEPGIG